MQMSVRVWVRYGWKPPLPHLLGFRQDDRQVDFQAQGAEPNLPKSIDTSVSVIFLVEFPRHFEEKHPDNIVRNQSIEQGAGCVQASS